MKHINRRFDKMRKEARTKFMSAGMFIRIIILLALMVGCKLFCDMTNRESIKYYDQQNERNYE